jgi:hypothetical protein
LNIINDTKSYNYQPSVPLRQFVQALLSDDVSGNKSKAEKITGVRRQRFYQNMAKAEFRQWFNEQCDKVLLINQATVAGSLLSMATKGDVTAIRTYYELIGKLKNKLEHSGKIQGELNKGTVCTHRETSFCPVPLTPQFHVRFTANPENEPDIDSDIDNGNNLQRG